MKQDKQTENDARLFFEDILQKNNFIEKLRSVTKEVRDKLSQFDPRKTEKITYPCEYLFTVILLAGMAGYKTKDGVWLFWQANRGILSEVFHDLFGEIPSTSTITRAQRLIEGDVLGDAIKEIMGRQYTCVRVCRKIYDTEVLSLRDVLACDGQAMRATARLQPDGSRSGGKQITSIVSYETGMTLGQVIHNKKNQEKQSIIDLAEDIDVSNTIMTWDAINTHPDLIEFAVSKKADVFASLKSNQGLTFEEIEFAYESYQQGKPLYRKPGHHATATDTVMSGSNHYTRRIVALRAEDCMSPDVLQKWPHIKTIAIIETESTNMVTGEVTNSLRYYITTLEMDFNKYPDFARDLIGISLKRWCVEVNHWHIDRFFDQDQAAYENDDAAFCSTIISKLTMSIFNFAKRAYAAEENRYKGGCTTPRLQLACENIKFSALLLESFFNDDAKHLTQDWMSQDLKFMKAEKCDDRGYWPDPEIYDHEPWPLQQFIAQHKKRKKRKTAA